MIKPFISLVSDFIDTNGKKILDQPDRFKSLFLDFSQNEYRAEALIFSQFLASKQVQELKNSDDVDTNVLRGISERFQQTYLFDKSACEEVVSTYAFFLGLVDERPIEQIVRDKDKTQVLNGQPITISKWKIMIITVVLVLALSFYFFGREYPYKQEISYSDFINLVVRNEVISVTIYDNNMLEGKRRLGSEGKDQIEFKTHIPIQNTELLPMLKEKGVIVSGGKIKWWRAFFKQ